MRSFRPKKPKENREAFNRDKAIKDISKRSGMTHARLSGCTDKELKQLRLRYPKSAQQVYARTFGKLETDRHHARLMR